MAPWERLLAVLLGAPLIVVGYFVSYALCELAFYAFLALWRFYPLGAILGLGVVAMVIFAVFA